jgi:hypothetical protein
LGECCSPVLQLSPVGVRSGRRGRRNGGHHSASASAGSRCRRCNRVSTRCTPLPAAPGGPARRGASGRDVILTVRRSSRDPHRLRRRHVRRAVRSHRATCTTRTAPDRRPPRPGPRETAPPGLAGRKDAPDTFDADGSAGLGRLTCGSARQPTSPATGCSRSANRTPSGRAVRRPGRPVGGEQLLRLADDRRLDRNASSTGGRCLADPSHPAVVGVQTAPWSDSLSERSPDAAGMR